MSVIVQLLPIPTSQTTVIVQLSSMPSSQAVVIVHLSPTPPSQAIVISRVGGIDDNRTTTAASLNREGFMDHNTVQ